MSFSSSPDENWSFAAMRHSAYIACNPSTGGIQDNGEITMNQLNIASEAQNQFAHEWSGKAKSFFFPPGWLGFKKFFSGYQGTREQVTARLARPDSFICLP